MIAVTRLNKKRLVLNAELIKFVESTPDTMITLTNGDIVLVLESVEQVVERAIDYGRRIRCFSADRLSPAEVKNASGMADTPVSAK